MGDSVGGAKRLIRFDADQLVKTAIESTEGLRDFGDFDGDWRTRFDSFINELESTGNLHTVGRLVTRQEHTGHSTLRAQR